MDSSQAYFQGQHNSWQLISGLDQKEVFLFAEYVESFKHSHWDSQGLITNNKLKSILFLGHARHQPHPRPKPEAPH